jgi:hypothetical protein
VVAAEPVYGENGFAVDARNPVVLLSPVIPIALLIAVGCRTITSTNYFVRLRNTEFNYSNNPTYYTGSNPQNVLPPFRDKALTYATTIGLYNDSNELLAVAKLSRPVQKSTDKEALIRVRLDY